MPTYTLYYFNGRGRAEILRMMFAAAGVQYTDKRFEFSEWDKYRNEMPCMVVPVLEFDGFKMPQTMSIARYLAREFGFYSNNNMDMMRMDYICDCFYEILDDYMRYFHWKNGRFRFGNNGNMAPEMGGNGDTTSDNYDNYMYWRYMNTFNRIMPFMERSLAMRNDGSKFFMGEQMMWCDMMFYSCMENMYVENQSMFSNYPKLMGLYNRVAGHPKITAYMKSRSNTNW